MFSDLCMGPDRLCVQEGENPNDNIESFDAIWYSALQVVITATANGVSF